jgi:signal transduction histidine kinase
LIKATARLVTHQQRGENIKIQIETSDDLPVVLGDGGQLQQAVVALATNAIDAMPEGGTLTLRAAQSGSRILIEVRDSGIGIPPENMTKIFDPFFTTKDIGRGTGLGLASVMVFYRIMEAGLTCARPLRWARPSQLRCQSRLISTKGPSAG